MGTIMILLRRITRWRVLCCFVFCLLELKSGKEKRAGLTVSLECAFCCCVDIRD